MLILKRKIIAKERNITIEPVINIVGFAIAKAIYESRIEIFGTL